MPPRRPPRAVALGLGLAALALCAGAWLPLLPLDHWTLAALVFPRLHLFAAGALASLAGAALWRRSGWLLRTATVLALGATAYQAWWLWPFSPLARSEVRLAREVTEENRLALLVANIYMENRQFEGYARLVRELDPHLVLTIEPDEAWAEALETLTERWPHVVGAPLDNTYGLLLHSRLPLVDPEVRYLVTDDVPSIRAGVRLPSGALVRLIAIHPRPPVPREAEEPSERDAELLIVGAEVGDGGPEEAARTVVIGDFNDVAWSPTTRLFRELSHLMDPRVGRRPHATFLARFPLWRFPIDHVFHGEAFELVRLERRRVPGADHLAVWVELELDASAAASQTPPAPEAEDVEQAERKIREGRETGAERESR